MMPDYQASLEAEEDYIPWDCDEQWALDEELGGDDSDE